MAFVSRLLGHPVQYLIIDGVIKFIIYKLLTLSVSLYFLVLLSSNQDISIWQNFSQSSNKLDTFKYSSLKFDPVKFALMKINDVTLFKKTSVVSSSLDMQIWLIDVWSDIQSARLYLFNRSISNKSESTTYLLSYEKYLENYTLARMYPVEIPVSDGLIEVCYYSLPLESDPDGTGHPINPLPTILTVHGGPQSRVHWGLDKEMQAWVSRGYAVLTCNFRGSIGYGKKFLNAGNKQWGKKMQEDLTDAVKWAMNEKISDPGRIAIMGGSYGGYATLAGLAFTPHLYSCGVDLYGISNLITDLKSIPPYWKTTYASFKRSVGGDPDTKEGREYLQSISPYFKADLIRKPILIGQGENDPRVNKNESDQIVEVLKKKLVNVTYLVFPNEGHGFTRGSRLAFFTITERFLEKCLGGRAELIGDGLSEAIVKFEWVSDGFL